MGQVGGAGGGSSGDAGGGGAEAEDDDQDHQADDARCSIIGVLAMVRERAGDEEDGREGEQRGGAMDESGVWSVPGCLACACC